MAKDIAGTGVNAELVGVVGGPGVRIILTGPEGDYQSHTVSGRGAILIARDLITRGLEAISLEDD